MATAYDSPIGLRELVMPLRSSRLPYVELKDIILLGDANFLEREWHQIYNFPKIFIVKGDPLCRADLRAVYVNTCAGCVVLSACTGTSNNKVLNDKAAILATLNIKGMTFEEDKVSSGGLSGFDIPIITELRQSNRF